MKAKELKKFLENVDDESEVIIARDAEGNNFSPLASMDTDAIYIPDTEYSGEVYSLEHTAEDACMSEDEWDEVNKMDRSLILFPAY